MYHLKSDIAARLNFEEAQKREALEAVAVLAPIDLLEESPESFAEGQWDLYQDEILEQVDDPTEAAWIFRRVYMNEYANAKARHLARVIRSSDGRRFYINSDDSLVDLAIRSGLFEVRKNDGNDWALTWNDAPYALCLTNQDHNPEIWGLGEEMDLETALEDYEHLGDHAAAICQKLGISCEEVA